jgi:hypothetical protein
MLESNFSLIEFSHSKLFEVTVKIKENPINQANKANILWSVKGEISQIQVPEISSTPIQLKKSQRLWEESCFECFFFEKDSSKYFELNLSTDGRYDVLCFNDYRKLAEDQNRDLKLSNLKAQKEGSKLSVEIQAEIPRDLILQPTLILKLNNGEKLYFASEHPSNEADFHLKF